MLKPYKRIKKQEKTRTLKGTGKGTGGTIKFNPFRKHGGVDEEGSTERPTFIVLGHEMAHASQANKGEMRRDIHHEEQGGLVDTEGYGSHIENKLRAEHKLPLREFYSAEDDGSFRGKTIWKGYTPLIDNKGKSTYPPAKGYDYTEQHRR